MWGERLSDTDLATSIQRIPLVIDQNTKITALVTEGEGGAETQRAVSNCNN